MKLNKYDVPEKLQILIVRKCFHSTQKILDINSFLKILVGTRENFIPKIWLLLACALKIISQTQRSIIEIVNLQYRYLCYIYGFQPPIHMPRSSSGGCPQLVKWVNYSGAANAKLIQITQLLILVYAVFIYNIPLLYHIGCINSGV